MIASQGRRGRFCPYRPKCPPRFATGRSTRSFSSCRPRVGQMSAPAQEPRPRFHPLGAPYERPLKTPTLLILLSESAPLVTECCTHLGNPGCIFTCPF